MLGVPLYAQPEDPAIKQVSYEALIKNNPSNVTRDKVSMNGTTYHYNGHSTLQKKTNLALDQKLGGMMLWEAGLDAQGSNSATAMIANVLENKDDTRFYSKK